MNDIDQARLDECPEPDWELENYAEHCDTVHDGAPCTCPPDLPSRQRKPRRDG